MLAGLFFTIVNPGPDAVAYITTSADVFGAEDRREEFFPFCQKEDLKYDNPPGVWRVKSQSVVLSVGVVMRISNSPAGSAASGN